jgi:hypothetical protein
MADSKEDDLKTHTPGTYRLPPNQTAADVLADDRELLASEGDGGDEREWTLRLREHPHSHGSQWHVVAPTMGAPGEAVHTTITVVPQSRLTAPEDERDKALDEITRTVNEYEKRRETWEAELERLREALTAIAEQAEHATAREAGITKTQQGDALYVIGRKARTALGSTPEDRDG